MQVVATVDIRGGWAVKWSGNFGLCAHIIGALEYAKNQAIAQMDHESLATKAQRPKAKVPRSKALDFYIDLRKTIEDRMLAIQQSDERAEFELPSEEI